MEDASNTVQILVAFAIQGIRFSSINRFDEEEQKNGQPDGGVCDIQHTVHSDEMFALRHENRNGST